MSTDGTSSGQQSNWSDTITFTPSTFSEPASVDELRKVLQDAKAQGKKVRPRGSGHSWNDAIVTNDVCINTGKLAPPNIPPTSKVIEGTDGVKYLLLTVPAGIDQGDFTKVAQDLGAPVPTQGPAPDITLSGFTANGCHGTGWNQPTIAELVYGFELLGPDGETLVFDETTMPEKLQGLGISPADMMNIVRVHFGALGVLTQITFKIPMDPFHIRATNLFVPITDVLDRNDPSKLQKLVEGHDYVELFWFPYNNWKFDGITPTPVGPETDTLWVMLFDRTTDPVNATEAMVELWNDAFGSLASLGGINGPLIAADSNVVPTMSSTAVDMMKAKNFFNNGTVFKPRDAFLYQKNYFNGLWDLEFTIPMPADTGFKNVVDGFYQLVDRMEAWRTGKSGDQKYPINLNVHARFVKNSQALLSPAYAPAGSSQHTCYIEYLSYSYGRLTADYANFGADFYSPENGGGWKKYGGIPNWGKALGTVPDIFTYVHDILNNSTSGETSRLQQFLQIREIIDPGGATFGNPYLEGFFTGVAPNGAR